MDAYRPELNDRVTLVNRRTGAALGDGTVIRSDDRAIAVDHDGRGLSMLLVNDPDLALVPVSEGSPS